MEGVQCQRNQSKRIFNGATCFLCYDEENCLSSIRTGGDTCTNGTLFATFTCDGNGNQVKIIVNNLTTASVTNYHETTVSMVKKYYCAGFLPLAVRTGSILQCLIGDNLGSTSITATASSTLDTNYLSQMAQELKVINLLERI